jgi:F0F1-type ATP synthase membrane subunit b/b'
MPQLDTTYYVSSVAWFLLCFGGLFILSQFWLIPRLSKLALQRKNEADSILKEITLLRSELSELEDQYKNQLDLAIVEIKQTSGDMLKHFSNEAEEILKDVNKSCEAIVADEENKMQKKFELILHDKDQIAHMLAEAFLSKSKSLDNNQLN